MEETTITSRQDGIEMERLHGRTTGVQTRARAVSYADLNLERKAGLDTLYSRLETASREVCSPRESYRTWAMSQDWQACYTHAMDKAVADVGNLDLQDYHLARIDEAVEAAEQVSDRR